MTLGGLPYSFNIFGEEDFDSILRQRIRDLGNAINQMDRNALLNANEPELIESYIQSYTYETAHIDFESISMSEREGRRQTMDFGEIVWIKGLNYTFHLPVSGELAILKMAPNPRILRTFEFIYDDTDGPEISFDVFGSTGDTDSVVREKDSILGVIKKQLDSANKQVLGHNENVKNNTERLISARKEEILKQKDTVSAIGVPLKKKEQVSKTFAAPTVKRKPKIIQQPKTTNETYTPEPTLHVDTYQEILKLIQEFGVEIERHPAIYEGKDEESLRDHFILILSPNFDGGVTGETFNRVGKTDILIRYESNNVFVAECKFWRGEKSFLDAIDQTLGYLTWRDSKAAIIFFVDNVQLDPVFRKIEEITHTHSCYADTLKVEDGRYEYRFHLKDDDTRNLYLTVLVFHFPKIKK